MKTTLFTHFDHPRFYIQSTVEEAYSMVVQNTGDAHRPNAYVLAPCPYLPSLD